ncbi:glycosyltransferase family 2 protein [Sulfuriroseicoccus oceanibius]|uniref:Glycosyltransferase n=1 Tax=Sulfuriroseicoccus oceanibius TaxID=2707525 RepID=A0A6B3L023_9BACT|nr:glycosyltransferase family 2 protein [Sulfuriroseicoccus oceanibius]QQL43686.1 glycosyltransferase [Sulfuriroseicoccus oceanibius]
MHAPPAISVVMPAFNAQATIERAIASITAQSFSDWELIIVNDGSSDDTLAIARQCAAADSRIRVLNEPHRGVVGASNAGFAASRAPVIARMDADDQSTPNRLADQYTWLADHPHHHAVSGQVEFAGCRESAAGYGAHVDWTNQLVTPEQIAHNRFVDLPFPHPSLMYRRTLVEQFGGYRDGEFPEDYELMLRWFDNGMLVGKVPHPVLLWNDPPTRLSRNDPRYAMPEFHRCKAPFLANAIVRSAAGGRPLWIWGAGRPARKNARLLEAAYQVAAGFIDIDPRKIGRSLAGRPIISADTLPPIEESVIVSYVGNRGAGQIIRDQLLATGRTEGTDFWIAA